MTDAEFEAKPMVLLIGQYSTGKTSVSVFFSFSSGLCLVFRLVIVVCFTRLEKTWKKKVISSYQTLNVWLSFAHLPAHSLSVIYWVATFPISVLVLSLPLIVSSLSFMEKKIVSVWLCDCLIPFECEKKRDTLDEPVGLWHI
jgi:hypothetical protein